MCTQGERYRLRKKHEVSTSTNPQSQLQKHKNKNIKKNVEQKERNHSSQPSLPPLLPFIRIRLRNISPMMTPHPPPPEPPGTSASQARYKNIENTCNAVNDSLQDTGNTIHDGHAHIPDRTKNGSDTGCHAAHFGFFPYLFFISLFLSVPVVRLCV